jgi:hypothetical protein
MYIIQSADREYVFKDLFGIIIKYLPLSSSLSNNYINSSRKLRAAEIYSRDYIICGLDHKQRAREGSCWRPAIFDEGRAKVPARRHRDEVLAVP